MTKDPSTVTKLAVEHDPRPGQAPCAIKISHGNTTNIERLTIVEAAILADLLNGYVDMYGGQSID